MKTLAEQLEQLHAEFRLMFDFLPNDEARVRVLRSINRRLDLEMQDGTPDLIAQATKS